MIDTPPPTVADVQRFCPACGYDLRGLPTDRCPECGVAFDPQSFSAKTPWVHRRRIGRARAFVQTVCFATFQPEKLADDVKFPIRPNDSVRFRRAVSMSALPILLGLAGYFTMTRTGLNLYGRYSKELGWAEWGVVPFFIIGAWLFLYTATGSFAHGFHPKNISAEQQNRATAIAGYACAPLALAWLPAILVCLLFQFVPVQVLWPPLVFAVSGTENTAWFTGVLFIVAAWMYVAMRTPLVLLRQSTGAGFVRILAMFLLTPLYVAILAVLFLVLLPFTYVFFVLMIESLL